MAKRRYGEGSVYHDEKRDLWIGQVELGRDINGKRLFKRVTSRDKKTMLEKMRTAQHRRDQGLPIPSERATTGEWLTFWIEHIAPDTLNATSLDRYQRVVRNHLVPHLGHLPLTKLQPEHVEKMMRYMRKTGHEEGNVAKVRAVLRRALTVAEERGRVSRNVVALTAAPKTERKTNDNLSPAEAERVLEHVRGDRLEAVAVLALPCGFRQHELLDLRWADVDLDRATVKVVKAKTKAGVRTVPLPAFAVAALRDHRSRQREERMASDVWGDPELVFTTGIGTRIDRRNILRWWHEVTTDSGVGRRRFHASRHTAASLMLNRGVPLEQVSRILGHSTYAITLDIYGHIDPETLRSGARAMDDLFGTYDREAT